MTFFGSLTGPLLVPYWSLTGPFVLLLAVPTEIPTLRLKIRLSGPTPKRDSKHDFVVRLLNTTQKDDSKYDLVVRLLNTTENYDLTTSH